MLIANSRIGPSINDDFLIKWTSQNGHPDTLPMSKKVITENKKIY